MLPVPPGVESPPVEMEKNVTLGGGMAFGWSEVQKQNSIEELQRQLEVEKGKVCRSIETQTDNSLEDGVPEDCFERWFAGFGSLTSEGGRGGAGGNAASTEAAAAGDAAAEEDDSSSESAAEAGPEGAQRPQRQIRRRRAGEASRSRSPGATGTAAAANAPAAATGPGASLRSRSSSSSSSSSSSTGGSSRRQRAPSTDDETRAARAATAGKEGGGATTEGAVPVAVTPAEPVDIYVDPRMRAVHDYADCS
eukprot:gnl/TRDRNA2_/TRDRNA2_166240_c0_seq1.p1 gnl/TRDRNA2_/TRDRNA2_166240_c0~~gnl/TRDRNA2_/TRDRNA2_166240_c0_seq1.p1  ORF type:complete len:251 (+),score=54.00 gnl/TRDRNA2_/TRDRNA2_166240_c0_seq1:96-848(+)